MTVSEGTDPFADFVAARAGSGGTCKMGEIQKKLSEAQASAVEQALAINEKIQSTASIATVLTKWGHSIKADTVGKHRRRTCSCYRSQEA